MEKWIILSEPYDNYAVSDMGQVKNIKTGKILSQHTRHDGYLQVTLLNKGQGKSFTVHRLVALNFLDFIPIFKDFKSLTVIFKSAS